MIKVFLVTFVCFIVGSELPAAAGAVRGSLVEVVGAGVTPISLSAEVKDKIKRLGLREEDFLTSYAEYLKVDPNLRVAQQKAEYQARLHRLYPGAPGFLDIIKQPDVSDVNDQLILPDNTIVYNLGSTISITLDNESYFPLLTVEDLGVSGTGGFFSDMAYEPDSNSLYVVFVSYKQTLDSRFNGGMPGESDGKWVILKQPVNFNQLNQRFVYASSANIRGRVAEISVLQNKLRIFAYDTDNNALVYTVSEAMSGNFTSASLQCLVSDGAYLFTFSPIRPELFYVAKTQENEFSLAVYDYMSNHSRVLHRFSKRDTGQVGAFKGIQCSDDGTTVGMLGVVKTGELLRPIFVAVNVKNPEKVSTTTLYNDLSWNPNKIASVNSAGILFQGRIRPIGSQGAIDSLGIQYQKLQNGLILFNQQRETDRGTGSN